LTEKNEEKKQDVPIVGQEKVKGFEEIEAQMKAARDFDNKAHEEELERIKQEILERRKAAEEERARHDELVRKQMQSGEKTEAQLHEEFLKSLIPEQGAYDEVDKKILTRLNELGKEYKTLEHQNWFNPDIKKRIDAISLETEALQKEYLLRVRTGGKLKFKAVTTYYPVDNDLYLFPHTDPTKYEILDGVPKYGLLDNKDREYFIEYKNGRPSKLIRNVKSDIFKGSEPVYLKIAFDIELEGIQEEIKQEPKKSLLTRAIEKISPKHEEKEIVKFQESKEIAKPIESKTSSTWIHCGCGKNYELTSEGKCPYCDRKANSEGNVFL